MGVCIIAYTLSLVLLYRSSPRPPSPRMSPHVPTVSLVIPTYNEASVIRQKLENVLQLDYPSEKLEVVVIDSASNDETGSIVRKLVENFGPREVGAVSGVEVPVGGRSFLAGIEADYRRIYTAIRMAEAETDSPFMCESELSAYRRELLEPLRPGVVCDDVELTVT